MLFNLPEPLGDDELESLLTAALRSTGPSLTREASCYLATVSARHLVNRLRSSGVRVVRVPERVPLKD